MPAEGLESSGFGYFEDFLILVTIYVITYTSGIESTLDS